jgi:hypothetical protein
MAFDIPERLLGRIHGPSLGSKRAHHDRFGRASFDSPCCRASRSRKRQGGASFCAAENNSAGITGNLTAIVHTAFALHPTAHQKLPYHKTA